MTIQYFENEEQLTLSCMNLVVDEIKRKPNLLLCAATGNSPLRLYRALAENARSNLNLYQQLHLVKLDEWLGLSSKEGSCEAYLQKELIQPLKISRERYISFDAQAPNPEKECLRIQNQLSTHGPLDLCLLGLGRNGHLGFNEPATYLTPHCHIARLTSESQQHDMIVQQEQKPNLGFTLGMKTILTSKRIVLLVSGKGKETAKQRLLSAEISPQCPATFLWLHHRVDCYIVDAI